jgi:hypothetical protein
MDALSSVARKKRGGRFVVGEKQPVRFAWCFSHGRLHTDPAWCTASWSPLPGATTEEEALTEKRQRFGDAEFLHQLPLGLQVAVIQTDRASAI